MDAIDPRSELLFAIADDELLLGHSDLRWTGVAPTVEEDVAFSSIAQDEIAHALALHELLGSSLGRNPNVVAFDRQPEQFRHSRLLEQPSGDFAFTIARRFVYQLADRARIALLAESAWLPLSELSRKIAVEETLHFDHAWLWLERLSARNPGRNRMRAALQSVLPLADGILAAFPGVDQLMADGILPQSWNELYPEWRRQLLEHLAQIEFADLWDLVPGTARLDRASAPSVQFLGIYRDIREVRTSLPGARW